MPLQSIADDCNLTLLKYEPVHGGDINRSFCLYTNHAKFFLKINDSSGFPGMFEKEAAGLNSLRDNFNGSVPLVIKSGIVKDQQYLLLEWIEKGKIKEDTWKRFGASLAIMHQKAQPHFGWGEDNYIGSLAQQNTKCHSWALFYSECRILPLARRLFNRGIFSKQDMAIAESFCKKLDQLFVQEPPSLLHGDLWSGNFMITDTGEAAIYDPAVYYGHREMDIGMTKLFGGFDQHFYDAYNDTYPLEKNWRQRLTLTQLYPLLVHAVLFGGHYVRNAMEIMKRFS